MKLLRPGVSRLREELQAAAGAPVVEVTAATAAAPLPPARIYVGTEAVLHQVDGADVVAFLDIDAELLAPRYRAAEEVMALLARAARLVGGRPGASLGSPGGPGAAGRLLVQTSLPRHEVLDAVLHADPSRFAAEERARRQALRFPPTTALAVVSGEAAETFVVSLRSTEGVQVAGPADGRWLVRAEDHEALCDALAATPRPPGRLRIEVDPMRL
jgi:primosomal protein N' (replication factor Y)